ncbi:hypothetical protein DPX16_20851 [Anabarilius grahami]|uniref:Uncharacterized protein n=1 Tax=Anabarilius grahami TaxID=495550 RepID=A0A3N0XRB3_ANAGA|nr:hypothetical protein DPX16_20851 [Anabarilius grahami]
MTSVSRRSVTLDCGSASGADQWSRCCCCESLSAAFTHSTAAHSALSIAALSPEKRDGFTLALNTWEIRFSSVLRESVSSREERKGVGYACEFSSRMIENVCQEKDKR